ncbi:MAG: succinyl-diaminopimelate desuccinylase [Vicinamibacterales bacterium]
MAHDPAADPQGATLDLLRRLVACRSVSPDDGGSLAVVAGRLASAGFACERLDRGGVGNLWATHGAGAPIVCLAGHVDVVPPGPLERWQSDPFEPCERDGWLYGRGAADMKGSVAAMVTAAARLAGDAPGHPGTLAVLLTADEEGDAVDGTAAVVDVLRQRGITIDACLLGEPTSERALGDTLKNGRRGSLNGVLRVDGVQCHVAYPERGLNPINAALPALAELAAIHWDHGDAHFAPTSFQFSNVHAGAGATNIIPGSLEVWFNVRFSPESPVERLQAGVRAVLDRHGLDYTLRWTVSALPFITPPGPLVDAVTEAVRQVTGVTPSLSTGGGTSDGRFLAGVARQLVEFGPVNDTIHQIDERIRIADLGPLSSVFERAARRLLGL